MDISMQAVYDAAAGQRNKAHDDLAYMTAYAKALEAKIAELEKPADTAAEPVAETPQNVTQ